MFYLAAPFTTKDRRRLEDRYAALTTHLNWYWRGGLPVVSPVAMVHPNIPPEAPQDYYRWVFIAKPLLLACRHMVILTLSGWEDSVGLNQEINLCVDHHIPYHFIKPAPNRSVAIIDFLRAVNQRKPTSEAS